MSFSQIIEHSDFTLRAATDVSKAQELAEIIAQNQYELRFLPHTSQISTTKKAVAEIENFKSMWENNGCMLFYFIINKSDKIVGCVGIKIKEKGQTAEGCYWLNKTETGKGYATNAVKLLEEAVFAEGYKRFEILCNAGNIASVKLPKRLNYHLDNVLPQADFLFDKYHDVLIFSKLNSGDEMNSKLSEEKSKITIRKATPDDAYDIKKVHIETYKESYRGYIPDEYLNHLQLDDEVVERTKKYLATCECWVAVVGENPVAFAYVSYPEDNIFEINALYVHPAYQKCGAGSMLVNYLCENKKSHNLVNCVVWTMKFGPSIPFYEKMNFKMAGEEKLWKFDIPIIKLIREL